MPDWLKDVFPLAAFIGQAGLVFFFLGKMKGGQDGSAALFATYREHQKQLLDEYKASTAAAISELKAAMGLMTSQNGDGLEERARLREELAAFRATTEAEQRFTRESVERVSNDVHSLQRQVANLAAGTRPKVTELSGPSM